MKKYFLLLNTIVIVIGLWTLTASAKRYRYIKREHAVQFQAALPTKNLLSPQIDLDMEGAYKYNWKGRFEFGPYFQLDTAIVPFFMESWGAGIIGEYNFIKNRGKRKFIPALGLSVGANSHDIQLDLDIGVHLALKYFVGKRTPFTLSIGYSLLTPFTAPFMGGITHTLDLSMGFSYYFDFY